MVVGFDKITDTVVECLLTTNNSPASKFNLFSGNLLAHNFQITNEQIKCLLVSMMYPIPQKGDVE